MEEAISLTVAVGILIVFHLFRMEGKRWLARVNPYYPMVPPRDRHLNYYRPRCLAAALPWLPSAHKGGRFLFVFIPGAEGSEGGCSNSISCILNFREELARLAVQESACCDHGGSYFFDDGSRRSYLTFG